jgi:anti-anti-sigma regulatory factor
MPPSRAREGLRLIRAAPARARTAIDLCEVAFTGSAGIGAVLSIRGAAIAAVIGLTLRVPSRAARRVLDLTGLFGALVIEVPPDAVAAA